MQKATKGACSSLSANVRRPTLLSHHVQAMVLAAEAAGLTEVADAFSVARGFLFRVPSEMIPLEWCWPAGRHSGIRFSQRSVSIVLARRKNCKSESTLRRECVCHQQGRRLCGFHRLHAAVERAKKQNRPRVFSFSYAYFLRQVKHFASLCGVTEVGTHAFRRGMAQDMAAQGCQLFEILQAGGWRSSSFMAYMKPHELQAGACAQLIADHSDSGEE